MLSLRMLGMSRISWNHFLIFAVTAFYDPNILAELECPICTEYMHTPIRQCRTGHSICDKCFNRVLICPICRAPRSHTRSLGLELLQSRLVFPCRNKNEGCLFIDLGPYIVEHENLCPYGAFPCLLSDMKECHWRGCINDFLDHAKLDHMDNVFLNSDNEITCRDFFKENDDASQSAFHAVFECDNQVFKCVWHVNYKSGLMRWCVFYVGVRRSPRDYIFEIVFENNNLHEKLSVKGTCRHYKQEYYVFYKNHCMFTNYHMLKKFCNGNDLAYKVKVTQNFYPRT